MLVFALLDPLKLTTSHLFVAVGAPERMVRARVLQLLVLVVGLFALGVRLGVVGVAIAMDAMVLVGTAFMLWQAKAYVDFPARRLFATPTVALVLATIAACAATTIPWLPRSAWCSGGVKVGVFSTVYAAVILLFEPGQVRLAVSVMKGLHPVPGESGMGGLRTC
jgi:hypothetical protein